MSLVKLSIGIRIKIVIIRQHVIIPNKNPSRLIEPYPEKNRDCINKMKIIKKRRNFHPANIFLMGNLAVKAIKIKKNINTAQLTRVFVKNTRIVKKTVKINFVLGSSLCRKEVSFFCAAFAICCQAIILDGTRLIFFP